MALEPEIVRLRNGGIHACCSKMCSAPMNIPELWIKRIEHRHFGEIFSGMYISRLRYQDHHADGTRYSKIRLVFDFKDVWLPIDKANSFLSCLIRRHPTTLCTSLIIILASTLVVTAKTVPIYQSYEVPLRLLTFIVVDGGTQWEPIIR